MRQRRFKIIALHALFLFISSSYCFGQDLKTSQKTSQDTALFYKDGVYKGKSQSHYGGEPYWGIATITINNGSLAGIEFMIRDSALHETFDGNYEKHFQGIPEYIQQSRNDWKGVQTYPKKLSEAKNIDKVDAMSGATWSCNIFKASVKEALKNAR